MTEDVNLIVKWNGKEFNLDSLTGEDNVANLKDVIFKQTGVRPERQKLLNLKFKGSFIFQQ